MIKVEELIQEIEGVEEMIGKEYEFRNEYKETTREYYEVLTQYYELINDVQTFTIKLRDFNDIDKEIEEQKNVLENLCLEMKTIEK
ncbi:hypothetical protein QTN25_010284 [Entamoeba marina]